jgi:hypothetical protein
MFDDISCISVFCHFPSTGTDTQGQRDEELGAKTCKGFANTANTALSSCIAAASRDSVTVTLEKPRSKTNETHSFSLNKAFNLPQIYSSRREPCIVFPHRQLAERMLGSTASFPIRATEQTLRGTYISIFLWIAPR